MAIIKIDDKDYDTDNLSDNAKKQIMALQAVDAEIRNLQIRLGIAQTARGVYQQLLKVALADPMSGDTIKLG